MSMVIILRCDSATSDARGYCTMKYVAVTDDVAQAYMVAITDGWACAAEGDFCPEHATSQVASGHYHARKT